MKKAKSFGINFENFFDKLLEKVHHEIETPYRDSENFVELSAGYLGILFSLSTSNSYPLLYKILYKKNSLLLNAAFRIPEICGELESVTKETVEYFLAKHASFVTKLLTDQNIKEKQVIDINFLYKKSLKLLLKNLGSELDRNSRDVPISLILGINSYIAYFIEKQSGAELRSEDFLQLYEKIEFFIREKSISKKIRAELYIFEVFILYIIPERKSDPDLLEKLSSGYFESLLNQNNKKAFKIIFEEILLPILCKNESAWETFFSNVSSTIKRNRNTKTSQIYLETFLLAPFKKLSPKSCESYSEVILTVISTQYNAFLTRNITIVLCEEILSNSSKLENLKKLINRILTKRELRPRDTDILYDVDEWMSSQGMGQNLQLYKETANNYQALPRCILLLAFQNLISELLCNPELDPVPFENFFAQFYAEQFEKVIERKRNMSLRPFEKLHKEFLMSLQSLLVFSEYIKNSKKYFI